MSGRWGNPSGVKGEPRRDSIPALCERSRGGVGIPRTTPVRHAHGLEIVTKKAARTKLLSEEEGVGRHQALVHDPVRTERGGFRPSHSGRREQPMANKPFHLPNLTETPLPSQLDLGGRNQRHTSLTGKEKPGRAGPGGMESPAGTRLGLSSRGRQSRPWRSSQGVFDQPSGRGFTPRRRQTRRRGKLKN